MLTMAMLDSYEFFGGDIDAAVRVRRDGGEMPSDADWRQIDELLLQLGLLQAGQVSPAFAARIEGQLRAATSDEAVRDRLRRLAAQRKPAPDAQS